MAEQNKMADWAPGTLDKTRQNIGMLTDKEAAEMAKKLGGEVMYERTSSASAVVNSQPRRTGEIKRNTGSSSGSSSSSSANNTSSNDNPLNNSNSTKRRPKEQLPEISKRENALMDKLMMSVEYKIKPNYGFFNFLRSLSKNGSEKILPAFVTFNLKQDYEHLEGFTTVIKKIIQIAPATYKAKILNDQDSKFKFLRMVASWSTQDLKNEYLTLQNLGANVVTADLIPFIRGIFKPIISIYYYGENKIQKLIKDIFADQIAYPDAPQEVLSGLAKQAITEWMYIENEIVKKLYPLLMRMCSETFELYPNFYSTKIAEILKFEGLHKFDLLLQDKQKKTETKEEEKKPKTQVNQKGAKDNTVIAGLKILNMLFPEAGFDRLDEHPDLYPYFQPLYNFDEGFNMLSPENPLQTIIVLLRIIEDCLQGCRNIEFNITDEQRSKDKKEGGDNIMQIMDDWSAYREDVFYRLYCGPLIDMVNTIYSQPDYAKSHIGKRMMNNLLWQITYHFLPNFKFDQLVLEHPADDSKFKPLFHRTDFARHYLTDVVNECESMAQSKGEIPSLKNPWIHYKFDIKNQVSKRLDVLLGAQNTSASTNANNANLLKYTLSFMAVLDWYINNPGSPAYTSDPMHIYRVSSSDGKPAFSVPARNDQNKLFAEAIKANYKQQAK